MTAAKPALATLAALVVLALASCAGEGYPPQIERNFLASCQAASASASVCQCSLTWLEHHTTYAEFSIDEDLMRTGMWPSDMSRAVAACK